MVSTTDNVAVSIIAPVYQGAAFLQEFHARMTAAAEQLALPYEIIFVNDGSTDATPGMLEALHGSDARVTVIYLSRNFGQLAATRTGLAYAKGRYIYVTDCDLEEAPEWLGLFYGKMAETGADIVFGTQANVSPQTLIERLGGKLMRYIIRHFSDIPMVENYVSARLMNRPYLDALLRFTERTGGFYILCQLTGFSQACLTVEKRYKGSSSYTLRKKMSVFIDHIVSATNFPIACILWVAGVIIAGALCAGLVLDLRTASALIAWSVWLMGGMVLAAIGIVGIYVSRVLTETKQRPVAIVRNILDAGC